MDFEIEETAEAPEGELPEGAWELLRDVFSTLEKALKIRRLYDASHALHRETEKELVKRFAKAIDQLKELRVDIGPESFSCGGRTIVREKRRELSTPYKLFRDGIRSITFSRGLTAGELRNLLQVLESRPDASGHLDEDMATLLWAQSFRHIEYICVDEIGFGEDGGEEEDLSAAVAEVNARIDVLLGTISSYVPSALEKREGTISVAAERAELYEMEKRHHSSEAAGDAEGDIMPLAEEAGARLRAEIDAIDTAALIERVVDILLDVMKEGECELSLSDVQLLLSQFLRVSLGRGDLPALNRMLSRLSAEAEKSGNERITGLTVELQAGLATEEAMELTADALRLQYRGGPEALEEYLSRLPRSALAPLAQIGREIEDEGARDVFRKLLVRRGGEDLDALIHFLDEGNPESIREAFAGIGEDSRTAELFKGIMTRGGTQAAVEAAKAIETMDEGVRVEVLDQVLRDPRPPVRRAGLRVVENLRDRRLLSVLIELVEQVELAEEEQIRMYHAIAVLGGDHAAEYLNQRLGPKRALKFRGKRALEFRHRALVALNDVRNTPVRAWLSTGTGSKDKKFARACRAALGMAPAAGEAGS